MEDGHRLTEPMLKKALARSLDMQDSDKIDIVSFDVSEGASKGDNFACVMKACSVKAKINGKEEEHHFMVKCYPMNELRVKFLKDSGLFEREIKVYMELMPALRKLDSDILLPKVPYGSSEEGVLFMENLKKSGFNIKDRGTSTKPSIL